MIPVFISGTGWAGRGVVCAVGVGCAGDEEPKVRIHNGWVTMP